MLEVTWRALRQPAHPIYINKKKKKKKNTGFELSIHKKKGEKNVTLKKTKNDWNYIYIKKKKL